MLRTKSLNELVTAGNKIKINDNRIVSSLMVGTGVEWKFFLKKISLNFSSKIYRSPRFIIYRRNFLPFPPFYRCDFFRIAENLERELSSTFHVLAWTRQRGNCKFYYIFAIISLRTHASIQDNWYFFISQRSLESQWATFVQ